MNISELEMLEKAVSNSEEADTLFWMTADLGEREGFSSRVICLMVRLASRVSPDKVGNRASAFVREYIKDHTGVDILNVRR